MAIVQPFNLEYWLITVFSGTEEIFSTVAIIILTLLSAKLRLNILTYVGFLTLFSIFMWYVYGVNTILGIIILIGGLVAFTILRKSQD